MSTNSNTKESDYAAVSKFAYGTVLLIIIAITGWYVIPRIIDRVYHGGFNQSKIDSIRESMVEKPSTQSQEELLIEVEKNNPNMDGTVLYKKTEEALPDSKRQYSEAEMQVILNSLNKK